MRTSIVTFLFLLILTGVSSSSYNGTRAPSKKAGAPGDGTCADSGCHNTFPLNSGNGNVSIVAPSQFSNGVPVDIEITVTDPEAVRFGFEITIMNDANENAGSFEILSTNTAKTIGNAAYVSHFLANANNTWTVRWNPPAETSQQNVTIYAAGNGADGQSNRDNDRIYTTNHPMEFVPATSAEESVHPENSLVLEPVSPNPSSNRISLFVRAAGEVTLAVADIAGRRVFEQHAGLVAGRKEISIDLDGLPPGYYIVRATSGRQTVTRPLILVR